MTQQSQKISCRLKRSEGVQALVVQTGLVDADELVALGQTVRRVARARGADQSTADDIAQETLTRLLAAGDRLEPEARLPWAITTAGNLLVNLHRDADRARRHQHRLLDLSAMARPENELIALEEAEAVRSALEALDDSERQLLVDHLAGSSTIDLAGTAESSPGAVAARLNRTRARMRLDYLLALRRVQLPTLTCRRVLLAVSAADQRRQHSLGAAEHLAQCPTCADLVAPLAERKSRLAVIAGAPLVLLGAWGGRIARGAHSTAVQATAVTAAVAVAAGGYALSRSGPPPPVPQAAQSALAVEPELALRSASGADVFSVQPARLKTLAGQRIIADEASVQSVVSYPGFWIGSSSSRRVYVHVNDPANIRNAFRAGQKVSFTATFVRNAAGFAAADGVTPAEGAELLTQQGVHIDVDVSAVQR
jgi:RNA polymerase sigma factor (sigma-70 family)